MTWQVGAFGILAVALAGGFAWYERMRPDARIVALVGTLAAFAALGRIAFVALPNVKPTTDIVLLSGYVLGGAPGFAVGEQDHALRERRRELRIMGGDDHGSVELAQERGELVLAPAVHPAGGFVQANDDRLAVRIVQHDRQGKPLLLASRQVARVTLA